MAGVLTNRREQAELVQRWRSQRIDQAADIGQGGAHLALEALQQRNCFVWVIAEHVRRSIDALGHAGEGRPDTVVQIAAQPAALLFPRGNQPLARVLEVGGQLDGVRGHTRLLGQDAEQPPIGR